MMPPLDLVGKVFGRLTAVRRDGRDSHGKIMWECLCKCGNITKVRGWILKAGKTKSCGCLYRESMQRLWRARTVKAEKRGVVKNGKRTTEYQAWISLKVRCYNPNDPGFSDYGGRGITVCDRWRDSFEAFLKDMGRKPSKKHSLDRIDNNGHYSPENCRWATRKQQSENRRPLIKNAEMEGLRSKLAEYERLYGKL